MMQSFVETPKQVRPAPMHDTRQRVARCGMSERRFVLVDFTHMNRRRPGSVSHRLVPATRPAGWLLGAVLAFLGADHSGLSRHSW